MKFKAKNSVIQNIVQPGIIVSVTNGQKDYADLGKITLNVTDKGVTVSANSGNAAVLTKETLTDVTILKTGQATVKSSDLINSLSSFSKDEDIFIETVKDNEFLISLERDLEENMSIPLFSTPVTVPSFPDEFDKESKINKEVFLKLMNKVSFATTLLASRPEFAHWILRLNKNKARSVAGNMNRFAIYDIEGDNIIDSNKNVNIAIHENHNNIISKVLDLSSVDFINIKEYKKEDNDDDVFQNQTVLELDICTLMLLNHLPGVKYIEEDTYLNRKSTIKFITSVKDWQGATKSLKATDTNDIKKQELYHWAELSFDGESSVVNVNSSVILKANRKVKILDGKSKIKFKCLCKYLLEVIDHAESDSNIQFEFVDNDPKSPLIARHYAGDQLLDVDLEQIDITSGIKEKYAFFFAPFNK